MSDAVREALESVRAMHARELDEDEKLLTRLRDQMTAYVDSIRTHRQAITELDQALSRLE